MTAPEAQLEDDGHGLAPATRGWFVVNLAQARARGSEKVGVWTDLEPPEAFEDYGIGVHVLQPGQPNGRYHEEDNQEDFLVLLGECIAIVEEQEHRLKAWDFVHCPRGTRHIFVGAGDGPCAILMVGTRRAWPAVSRQRGRRPPRRVGAGGEDHVARGVRRRPAARRHEVPLAASSRRWMPSRG